MFDIRFSIPFWNLSFSCCESPSIWDSKPFKKCKSEDSGGLLLLAKHYSRIVLSRLIHFLSLVSSFLQDPIQIRNLGINWSHLRFQQLSPFQYLQLQPYFLIPYLLLVHWYLDYFQFVLENNIFWLRPQKDGINIEYHQNISLLLNFCHSHACSSDICPSLLVCLYKRFVMEIKWKHHIHITWIASKL